MHLYMQRAVQAENIPRYPQSSNSSVIKVKCVRKKKPISMFLIKPLNKFQKIFVMGLFLVFYLKILRLSVSPSRCFPMSLSVMDDEEWQRLAVRGGANTNLLV